MIVISIIYRIITAPLWLFFKLSHYQVGWQIRRLQEVRNFFKNLIDILEKINKILLEYK